MTSGTIKKRTMQGVAAFMMLVLLAGCGGGVNEALVTGGSKGNGTPVVETETEAGPRVMLSGNGKILTGSTEQLLAGEFDAVTVMRTDNTEDDASATSLGFSLEKKLGKEGILTINGSLTMVKDASYLFDIPYTEDADPEESVDGGAEADPEESVDSGAEADPDEEDTVPDRVNLSAEEGAALLEEIMGEILSATEPGASLQTENAGNITWQYGAAKALDDGDGSSILNFCASAEADGVLLYLNAGAAVRGTNHAKQELERVEEGFTGWMKSLAFGSTQGDFLGGNDCMKLSFAGKTLYAPGTDYLRAQGAALSYSCGETFLDASYDGIVGEENGEAFFYASLKSKNAMTEEELAETEGLEGETLKGKNLDWSVCVTEEEDGSLRLFAETEAEGQTLYFWAAADSFGDHNEEAGEHVINCAKGWLAALELK